MQLFIWRGEPLSEIKKKLREGVPFSGSMFETNSLIECFVPLSKMLLSYDDVHQYYFYELQQYGITY